MKNIFHIGYHKTATTWFQNKFYPLLKNYKVVNRSRIRDFFYEEKAIEFTDKNNLIFCDEELSGNIHNGGYLGLLPEKVCYKISKFKQPHVIIFIRNQYDIIVSSYLQYIKEGGNYSLKRYLNHKEFDRKNRSSLFSFSHFKYDRLIQKYIDQIGEDNVYVYLYEDFKKDKDNFISNFIRIHQFDIDKNSISYSKSNSSYSYVSLIFARILNSFTRKNVIYKYYIIHIPYVYEYVRELLRRISILPIRSTAFLDEKMKKKILYEYSESNKILIKKYNLDLERYNYPL